jgi:protein TonB
MAKDKFTAPAFNDIVFENRNKEYGAYAIRKKYSRTLLLAMLIGIILISTAVITPYLNAKAMENKEAREERKVEITMENLDQPSESMAAPAPPPPPPPAETAVQNKYVPPEVVDSVKPEEMGTLMTADEAVVEIRNEEVTEEIIEFVEEVQEEIQEEEVEEAEPFVIVEEMPSYPGGMDALLEYVGNHIEYPEVAKENNIQGRVVVRFCVTPSGGVSQAEIYNSVDPELDAEAIRVVNTLPKFIPGKQGGVPVPVWFILPITFTLK